MTPAVAAALLLAASMGQPDPVTCMGQAGETRVEGALEQGSLLRGSAPPGTVRITHGDRLVPMDDERRFIFGIDRDAGTFERLSYHYACGRTDTHDLMIAPRAWRIERVNVARRLPQEGSESYRLREAEVLRMNAARERRNETDGWRQDFIWPARGRISGRFGSQRIYRGEPGSFHGGVDVAAGAGAPVVAPANGVVVLAGGPPFSLEGNLVIIDHGHGLNSAFLHLSSVAVREGQRLRQGDPVGAVGATGRATGPHLHWSLTLNGARLDPERVAGPMR